MHCDKLVAPRFHTAAAQVVDAQARIQALEGELAEARSAAAAAETAAAAAAETAAAAMESTATEPSEGTIGGSAAVVQKLTAENDSLRGQLEEARGACSETQRRLDLAPRRRSIICLPFSSTD